MKKILVLNGSFCEKPIIIKAKEMGYYVVTTGNAPDLIGHKYSDEYIPCDYSDKEKILELVKEHKIEGIVSCANDFGVLTAAYVAEKMGWKGHDKYETAKLIHHKNKFKEYCLKNDIPSPHSVSFDNEKDTVEFCKTAEYPIIVKANDLTGGKGINRANNFEEAENAVKTAFKMSRDKHILVEPFLIGVQESIDLFVVNKKIVATSGCTAYSQKNPYLIQCETFPPIGFSDIIPELHEIAYRIINDLDLADGIIALQYIKKDGHPYIIEMMRRCFGNEALLLSDMITGFPWEEAYIRAALGLDCTGITAEKPPMKYCGHFGIMADCNGVVHGYSIDSEIKKHIFKITEMVQPGGRINNYLNERIAYIYYQYDDIYEMNNEVVTFNDRIKIDITPEEQA